MHLHWWKPVEHPYSLGHYGNYWQCRCGKRKADNNIRGGYQPIDHGWVKTGRWGVENGPPKPPPPPGLPRRSRAA